jgi:acyl dehydratase
VIPIKHIRHQGPVIASLAKTAVSSFARRDRGLAANKAAAGRTAHEVSEVLAPRPSDLVRDYVREVGGDPAAYRESLPPHFFCQWGLPLAARTLLGQPYPLHRALNAGCRLEVRAPIPARAALRVTAKLEEVDDDGRRVLFRSRVWTSVADGAGEEAEAEAALVGDLYVLIPLGGGERGGKRRERARVPAGARELAYWRIDRGAGLRFALLTGDVNPLHWVPAYARAMGLRSTVLHGFATMARAWEGLTRGLYARDPGALRLVDVQFTRPLLLPARVGLYVDGDRVHVGDAPGGPSYLAGSFAERNERNRR